jgi:hypothetical protein
VSLGSYEGVFIDIEDAAFKMCPSTMMRNSSRVVLSIPRLSGVYDGEYRRRVICRVARGLGRAGSHPTVEWPNTTCAGPKCTSDLVLILFIMGDSLIKLPPDQAFRQRPPFPYDARSCHRPNSTSTTSLGPLIRIPRSSLVLRRLPMHLYMETHAATPSQSPTVGRA